MKNQYGKSDMAKAEEFDELVTLDYSEKEVIHIAIDSSDANF